MFLKKKAEKWHEVRWFNGPRDIYLALQFGREEGDPKPTIERIRSTDPKAVEEPLDEELITSEIDEAVAEYNRRNLCSLRVAGIRYRAKGGADPADHGAAATKLLNLL